MKSEWLGNLDYARSLVLQKQAYEACRLGETGKIYGLEYQKVITLGLRATDQDIYDRQDFEVVRIDRGGYATLHSVGQLVIYPVLDLKKIRRGPAKFIQLCLSATVATLAGYEVKAELDIDRAGVYVQEKKIAFCGFRIKNGVVLHGLSLNVNNNLREFEKIKVCGSQNSRLTRLYDQTQSRPPLSEIFDLWVKNFNLLSRQKVN